MKRIITYILFIFFLMTTSCGWEEETEMNDPEMTVDMNISTRTLDPDVKLRILVVDELNNRIIINSYPASANPVDGEYKIRLKAGNYQFYLLANEPLRLTPLLNEITHRSQLTALEIKSNELPETEFPDDEESTTSTNIPAWGVERAIVRAKPGVYGRGEISADNGNTWNNVLEMSLDRLAIKLTLALRKQTTAVNDIVIIKRVQLENVAKHGHILNDQPYDGTEFQTLDPCPYMSGFSFNTNTTPYLYFFNQLILPEYIMPDPAITEQAMTLKIEATYNGKNVTYSIPVRGNLDQDNYSLFRNNHYVVMATIKSQGDYTNTPEITYQVVDWQDELNTSNFFDESNIQYGGNWAPGNNVDIASKQVYTTSDQYVEYYFAITSPSSVKWAATITNPIDFMFDYSNGAVSSGTTERGRAYIIRIKPRKETSLNNIKTAFFITVYNGVGHIELNLPQGTTGTGNRYTIIQIPN